MARVRKGKSFACAHCKEAQDRYLSDITSYMTKIRAFIYLAIVELLATIIYAVYVSNTQNLELGAIVVGFIVFTIVGYYLLYCVILERLENQEKQPSIFWLLFFNIFPFLFWGALSILG